MTERPKGQGAAVPRRAGRGSQIANLAEGNSNPGTNCVGLGASRSLIGHGIQRNAPVALYRQLSIQSCNRSGKMNGQENMDSNASRTPRTV